MNTKNSEKRNRALVSPEIFLVWSDEVTGRIDPFFYRPIFKELVVILKKSKYKTSTIKDIAEIFSGQRPKGGVRNIDDGVPSLGGEHVLDSGEIKTEELKFIPEEFHQKHLNSKVGPNDIILVKDGATTGKVGIIPDNYPHDDCNINEHVFAIRIKDRNTSPAYVFSVLYSEIGQLQIKKNITGATVTGLTRESVESILVPLPEIKIQQKIVSIVQKAYEEKRKKEEEIRKIIGSIDGYVLSELGIVFQRERERVAFGVWSDKIINRMDPLYLRNITMLKEVKPRYRLSSLSDLISQSPQYGANVRAVDGLPGKDIRYIRITDIDNFGNLREDDWKTAEMVQDKYLLEENDLLFARSGATAGKSFIYKKEFGKAIFAGYMIRFKIDENKANAEYVFNFTQTSWYNLWVKTIQRPSGQPNINSQEYQSLEIPLPPLSVQEKIAGEVEARRQEAARLKRETDELLREAKQKTEEIILRN